MRTSEKRAALTTPRVVAGRDWEGRHNAAAEELDTSRSMMRSFGRIALLRLSIQGEIVACTLLCGYSSRRHFLMSSLGMWQ